MKLPNRHPWLVAVTGVFLAVGLVLTSVWLVVRHDGGDSTRPPAAVPAVTSPSATSPTAPGVVSPTSPGTVPATMTVKVYFHRGPADDPTKVVAVRRIVPHSPKVATAALTQLLAGPTSAERATGYWSVFGPATAGMLRSVRVADQVGYADFRDLRPAVPSAGSSAGTAAMLTELDTTFKQFSNVRRTLYSLNGDVPAFYEWLQLSPPDSATPTLGEAQRVARTFLSDVVGMRDLTFAGSRWRSDFIATVDFRTRVGENKTRLGPPSRVVLGRSESSFTVYGVTTDTIRVDKPAAVITPGELAVVISPLTISGEALAFEGTVNVRVVQVRNGAVRQLGAGHVTGGGDVMRPFTGQISFATPSTDLGWVLATELSAYNGSITKVTAVRVAFTPLGR
jgi:hypothetical protein